MFGISGKTSCVASPAQSDNRMGNPLFGRLFLVISFSLTCCNWVEAALCMDGERRALTKFRNGLNDPFNRLSSWGDLPDCCKWRGITCDKKTGYVIKLDLRNNGYWNLSGELDPSLLELKHLRYLDLSFNSFDINSIPAFLGSLSELRYLNLSNAGFKGIVPSQLGNLSMLEYLDVSCYVHRDFSLLKDLGIDDLQWLGKMSSLKYLNMNNVDLSSTYEGWHHILNRLPSLVEVHLGNCYLSGIPLTLPVVNITSLRLLDLSSNNLYSMIPIWMASLNNLVSLDLSNNRLYGAIPSWLPKLELLQEIELGSNNLHGNLSHILEGVGRKIQRIGLSGNIFYGEIPSSISNMTSLIEFRLSDNQITGSIPESISNLQNLELLDLSNNQITGSIPKSISNLQNLELLDLSYNHIIGSIPESISNLQNLEHLDLSINNMNGGMILDRMCRLKKLKALSMEECKLSGPIPRCLGELSFLDTLKVRSNNLSGVLPETLGQLAYLRRLDIGYNSLSGTVSGVHFRNLSKLKELDMSSNSLALQFHEWSPPFQLNDLSLRSCNLGPNFPSWLKLQKHTISILDISNASISDDMPDWFWDFTPQLTLLNLSSNKIKGNLPDPLKMQEVGMFILKSNLFWGPIPNMIGNGTVLDISNNNFSGPLPQRPNYGSLTLFLASNNHINGTIPPWIGECDNLRILDLSRNKLKGNIPPTIGNCTRLQALDLSKNVLQGEIPESLGHIQSLIYLHLNKNNLSGGIPNLLDSNGTLWTIDLGENNLSGDIPVWIGDLVELRRLSLRSNLFSGEIPLQLSNAISLQVLDLSNNKLIGSIPPSFGNLTSMKLQQRSFEVRSAYYEDKLLVLTKNQILEYTKILELVTSLDLSNNDLVGDVPEELTRLVGLHTLNLFGNHFTGKIPENISNLNLLESLDLSRNQFFGLIPRSLADVTSLAYLNLSYNNLSGKIPTGPQLQSFDESSYTGNVQLCGPPLTTQCPGGRGDLTPGDRATSSNEEGDGMGWVYAGVGPGFAVGCSGILLTLIFKTSWRIALFRFADGFSS